MILTVVVHRVALLLRESAVLALLIGVVRLRALASHVANELIKGLVLTVGNHASKLINAIRTLLIRIVVTLGLRGGH